MRCEHGGVRVLGPVEAVGPLGTTAPSGVLPRAFLAALAMEAPRPVSIDRLTALLWNADPPNGVKGALQQIASRIRRSLEAVGLTDVVRSQPPGYVLAITADCVDLRRFRDLSRRADARQELGDHEGAATIYADAVALWRGGAIEDLSGTPLHAVLAHALDDERARTEERRAVSLGALGRHAEAAANLAAATARTPLDERLWALQAQALIQDGRPAEAARVVQVAMAVVTATLGVPPGPALMAVEQSLLHRAHHRPSVDESVTGTAPPGDTRVRRPEAEPPVLHEAMRRALDRAEQAAVAAHDRRAHDEAVRQWQRALDLLDGIDPGDDRTRLRLLLGLSEAHNLASVDSEARHTFLSAIDVARRLDDPIGFAAAALGYSSDRIAFAPPAQQTALLTEALVLLPPTEHGLRSKVLSRLATEVYWQGSVDRTLELAHSALHEADLADDTECRLSARYALAFGCWTPTRAPELLTVCTDYLADALDSGDRYHEMMARRWLAQAASEMGDVRRGVTEAVAAVALADEENLPAQQWMNRTIAATQWVLAGDLDRAEVLATEALALGSVVEPQTSIDYVGMVIWNIHWLRGDLAAIVALVEEVAGRDGVGAARQLGLAMTFSELGRLDEARALLAPIGADALAAIPRDASWYFAMAALAESAAATADTVLASHALTELMPYRDRIAVNSLTTTGPIAHQAALAAECLGRNDLAIELFEQAIDIAERSGTPAFAARSRRALERCRARVS